MTKFDQLKCWIKYNILGIKRTSKDTQGFWNKADGNNWENYKKGIEKSKFITSLINLLPLNKNAKILELGCNVGRNLNFLYTNGYKNLFGIELNKDAAKNKLDGFEIANYSIEEYIAKLTSCYDLIFTMAVLEHLPKESEWIFAEMVKHSKYIITIEDEHSINKICFPRNYKKIFESLGMKQIKEYSCEGIHSTLTKNFRARIFKK